MFEFIIGLALLPVAIWTLWWIIVFILGLFMIGKNTIDSKIEAKREENRARVELLEQQIILKNQKEILEWGSLSNRGRCSMLLENTNFNNTQKREFFIKWCVPEAKIKELLD